MEPYVTLVLGGGASGKSSWAEAFTLSQAKKVHYVATAQITDIEMEKKIALHKKRRGREWDSIEEPLELCDCLNNLPNKKPILVDCATMWLSNLFLAKRDIEDETSKFCQFLLQSNKKVIIVSNEVGLSIIPHTKLGREFQVAQGILNQKLAKIATNVVLIVAGYPKMIKGQLNEVLD